MVLSLVHRWQSIHDKLFILQKVSVVVLYFCVVLGNKRLLSN
jgi:hypothetical protein